MRKTGRGWAAESLGWPPVSVHGAVFLLPFALTFPLWGSMTNSGLLTALFVIPACVLSILAHELGHAFAARRYGLEAVAIRLLPMGGEALLAGEPPSRSADRMITLAGPLANLVIGLSCLGAYFALVPHFGPTAEDVFFQVPPSPPPFYIRTLLWVGCINVVLAGVNLLPAYPLDGGKLAESFIKARWGSEVARFWIGTTGMVFAVVSTVMLFATLLVGAPVWSPPSFRPNWRAIAASRWRPWSRGLRKEPPAAGSTGRDATDWREALEGLSKGKSRATNVTVLKPRSRPGRTPGP